MSAAADKRVGCRSMDSRSAAHPRLRFGLVWARFVLPVANIKDRSLQAFHVIDESLTSPFGPPVLPQCAAPSAASASRSLFVELLQRSSTPGFQLAARRAWSDCGGQDHMQMICPAIDGVKMPAAEPASLRNLILDCSPLFQIEQAGTLDHFRGSLKLPNRVGHPPAMSEFNPAAIVAGQPCPVRRPSEEVSQRLR